MKLLFLIILFAPFTALADDGVFSNAVVVVVSAVANAMDTGGDDE